MESILLVEDEDDIGSLLKEELEIHGYRIIWVKNGVDAVLAAMDNKFDILIVDMIIPDLSGINTIRIISKIAPGIAVIACSGMMEKNIMIDSVAAGASVCVNKPFTISQMLSHIRWAAKHKKGREGEL